MSEALEHHEHIEHTAHEGRRLTALLVAVLAAALALSEQGAKHAEIKVQEGSISAADAWAQYQAKSIRSTIARDLSDAIASLDPPAAADLASRRAEVIARLNDDARRYDHDPKDGKEAIATRARELEAGRNHALEETHAYHNAAAMLELGIVLATASAIIGSRLLLLLALGLGVGGGIVGLLGLFAPALGAF